MTKRVFDIIVAASILFLTAPIIVIVAIMLCSRRGGPVLFRQTRIGKGAKPFVILKFRTMTVGKQRDGITVGLDARITSLGHILRQSKIDELPQLWNVLRGEMSVVGPRPEIPSYFALYPEVERTILTSVRPGITDYASIVYRNEAELLATHPNPEGYYRDFILPHKIALGVAYVQNRSLLIDIRIIVRTILAVFQRQTFNDENIS